MKRQHAMAFARVWFDLYRMKGGYGGSEFADHMHWKWLLIWAGWSE